MSISSIIGRSHFAAAAAAALVGALSAVAPAHAAVPGSAGVANRTLTITGTSGQDRVAVAIAADDQNVLQVTFGSGTPQRFDRATFNAINASLGNGDDSFTEGHGFTDPTTVDAGNGNDTVLTGDGEDLILGGTGNDRADGGRGRDIAFLDSGTDAFQWDPGDGSDVIDGGTGNDTLVFNGANIAETMSLSASGSRAVFLRDIAGIRMDMSGVEALALQALGGADKVTVNDMTGTDLRTASIDLGGADNAADAVTVNGTDNADRVRVTAAGGVVDVAGLKTDARITGSEPTDHLQVNTFAGNDNVTVDKGAARVITVGTDLGTGQR
jgi:Ca2+-binding RTX toxin-like protein